MERNGYRFWPRVTVAGTLASWSLVCSAEGQRSYEWLSPHPVRALCMPRGASANGRGRESHIAPGAGCECGIRVVKRLGDVVRFVRWWAHRRHPLTGLNEFRLQTRSHPGDDYADRDFWGVLDVPDVIGRATGSGCGASDDPRDPPDTWRCEFVGVGDRLYLSPHLWAVAQKLADARRSRLYRHSGTNGAEPAASRRPRGTPGAHQGHNRGTGRRA